MGRKAFRVGGAAVVVIVVVLLAAHWLGRPALTDEQKIQEVVARAQKAVEMRNSTGLTHLISQDYADRSGVNRQQLVAMIVQWMRGGEEILAVPEITGLQVRPPFADLALRVRVWRGREPSGSGQDYAMSVRLQQEGRDWKVISAEGWTAVQSDVMNATE